MVDTERGPHAPHNLVFDSLGRVVIEWFYARRPRVGKYRLQASQAIKVMHWSCKPENSGQYRGGALT